MEQEFQITEKGLETIIEIPFDYIDGVNNNPSLDLKMSHAYVAFMEKLILKGWADEKYNLLIGINSLAQVRILKDGTSTLIYTLTPNVPSNYYQ